LILKNLKTMKKKKLVTLSILAAIPIISLLLHFPIFKLDLIGIHVWRQTQTQLTVKNFYDTDFNILNPRINELNEPSGIQRMEFPMMQWLFAGVCKIFGYDVFWSRVLTFIMGLLSVFGMFSILRYLFNNQLLAACGAWAFNFSPVFYYYTLTPLPDNMSLCFAIWGVSFFLAWYKSMKIKWFAVSLLFFSLASLVKLPFVIYFSLPVTLIFLLLFRRNISGWIETFKLLVIITLSLIPAAAWYVWVIPTWGGNGILRGILDLGGLSSSEIFYILKHNLVSTLPEMLLNYGSTAFFIIGLYFFFKMKYQKSQLFLPFLVLAISSILYFLFELNMISTVHDYYLFPFLPQLFVLVALGLQHLLQQDRKWIHAVALVLLLVLPFTAYIRIQQRWNTVTPGFNADLLKYKTELRLAVPKDAKCVIGNDVSRHIMFYYLDKKGWSFQTDDLQPDKLKEYINAGATYMYSDSRNVENNAAISPFLEQLVYEVGSVKVFRLRNGK